MKKIIIFLLMVSMLSTCFVSAVGAESREESKSFDYKDENLIILEELLAELELESTNPKWGSGNLDETNYGTHGFIAANSLTLIENKFSTADTFFTTTRKKKIFEGSVSPDVLGPNAWRDHFYLPNGEGLWGYPLSAYNQFSIYYNLAVSEYRLGHIYASLENLGKSLHFISDINEPHHSSGLSAISSRHTEYENWVEERYNLYKVNSITTTLLNSYNVKTLKQIADDSAALSRGQISNAESTDETAMGTATTVCLKNAQKDAAGVIYKFCKETGIL